MVQDDMGELGLFILEKAYGRFDTGKPASLDKLQFTRVTADPCLNPCSCLGACLSFQAVLGI